MKNLKFSQKQCADCKKYAYSWSVKPAIWGSDKCWKHLSNDEKCTFKKKLQSFLDHYKSLRDKKEELIGFNQFLQSHEIQQLLKENKIDKNLFINIRFSSFTEFEQFDLSQNNSNHYKNEKYNLAIIIINKWESYKKEVYYKEKYISLAGANLSGINFSDCNIEYVVFDSAIINNVNMNNTKLDNVIFDNASIRQTDFNTAQLESTSFRNANIKELNFNNNTKLDNVIFDNASIHQVGFVNAYLQAISVKNAKIELISFINSNGQNLNISQSVIDTCKVVGCQFSAFICDNSRTINAHYNDTYLKESSFIRTDLSYSDFSNSILLKTKFNDANLSYSIFLGADISESNFIGADLYYADMRDVNFEGVELYKSKLRETKVYFEDVKVAKIFHNQLHDNSFQIERKEKVRVFISYSHSDVEFAERIASSLQQESIDVWIDRQEILVGDSLIEKIREGLDNSQFVCAILSEHSIRSNWVRQELDIAMNQQIASGTVKVIPIVITRGLNLPNFLIGKLYVDLSDSNNFTGGIEQILRRINR